MKSLVRSVLPALLFLSILVPVASARPGFERPERRRESVPDGGSAVVYVIAAASACLGAVTIRLARQKSSSR